jgi:hypothetical protein
MISLVTDATTRQIWTVGCSASTYACLGALARWAGDYHVEARFEVTITETIRQLAAPMPDDALTPMARSVYWSGDAKDEDAAKEAGYAPWDEKYGAGSSSSSTRTHNVRKMLATVEALPSVASYIASEQYMAARHGAPSQVGDAVPGRCPTRSMVRVRTKIEVAGEMDECVGAAVSAGCDIFRALRG